MLRGVERCQREHAQGDAEDVRDRAALALVHILLVPLSLDPEFDRGHVALKLGVGAKPDGLFEHLLQGDGRVLLDHLEQVPEEPVAEDFESARDLVGDSQILGDLIEPLPHSSGVAFPLMPPAHKLVKPTTRGHRC